MNKKTEIRQKYFALREKKGLSFIADPLPKNIKKCLIHFLTHKKITDKEGRIVRAFFNNFSGDLLKLVQKNNTAPYKPIQSFLSENEPTEPKKDGLEGLVELLLRYEVEIYSKSKKVKSNNYIALSSLIFNELGNDFKFSVDFFKWLHSTVLCYKEYVDITDLDVKSNDFKLFVLPKSNLDKDEIKLAFKLAFGLYNIYKSNEEYNFIRIYADVYKKLKPLHINNFFVNLSILNSFELKKKEELLRKENESFSIKIRRVDISNLLSQQYLSHKIIFNTERIIISGNPGTGKSTYTYKLCHQWIYNELQINKQPIHIQLKKLRFGAENSILKYIKNQYLGIHKVDKKSLLKVLRIKRDSFIYILDGFDEIESQYRSKLFHDLNSITDQYQFILTSRPYGLLNFPIQVQNLIQIDGFNESSISNYIDSVVSANQKSSSEKDELKNIIKKNNVLNELSHNPLMLSFMVSMFLLETKNKEKLEIVDSLYELQLLVFNWLEKYKNSKPLQKSNSFWPDKNTLEKIAWDMQNKKTYVTSKIGYEDSRKSIFLKLSDNGIGNLYDNKTEQNWSFSFNTITFQEFFSANYYAKNINIESFEYISKDLFFWNFNRMVSGFLSANNEDEVLKSILKHLFRLYYEGNKRYYLYLYYSLLSEAKSSFLNTFISKPKIKDLIEDYKIVSRDINWQPILFEIIQRIVFKLSDDYKRHFLKEINSYLSNIKIDINNSQITYLNVFFMTNLAPLIKEIEGSKETLHILVDLMSAIFEELEKTLKTIRNYSKEEKYVSDLKNILVILFPFLKALMLKDTSILKNFEKYSNTYSLLDIAMIKSQYHCLDASKNTIDKLLEEIEKLSNNQKVSIHLVTNVASQFYVYCSLINKHQISDDTSVNKIKFLAYWIVTSVYSLDLNEYETEEFCNAVVFGLKKCHHLSLYDDLFSIVNSLDYYTLIDFEDHISFENYIKSLFEKINKVSDKDYSNRDKLFKVFEKSNNGRYLLSKYREPLFDIFKDSIEKNKEWITGFKNISDLTDYQLGVVNALESFKRCVYFDFDKKFFVDKILEDDFLMECKYVKLGVLSHWFTYDLGFLNDKYWSVFKILQNEIDYEEFLFPFIYYNHKTFKLSENITHLFEILDYLAKDDTLEKYIDNNDVYIVFCSKLLTLLLLNKETEISNRNVQLLKKILRNKKIRTLLNDPYIFKYMDSSAIMAFVMIYFFTQDKKDLTGFNYSELLNNNLTEKRHFFDYIIDFFSRLENGFLHNIRLVKNELGDEIFNQILIKHKDFTFEDFQYDRKKLLKFFQN